jgi:hypothetical protein
MRERFPKTTAHLFLECVVVKQRWIQVIYTLRAAKIAFGRANTALEILTSAVRAHQKNPAWMVMVAKLAWCSWVETNSQVFQGSSNRMPIQVILRNCVAKLEAMEATTENSRKLAVLQENRQILLTCAQALSTAASAP